MKHLVSLVVALSSICLGFSLFFSCDHFELQLVESGLSSYFYCGVVARLIICLLFVVGGFSAFSSRSKIIYYLGFILFGVFLLMQFKQVNDSIIITSPFYFLKSHSLILFILLISCLLVSIKAFAVVTVTELSLKLKIAPYLLSASLIAAVFIYNPLFPEDFYDSTEITNLDEYSPYLSELSEEVTSENQLFAFFSTACPYCEIASKRLAVLSKVNDDFPEVKVFFMGTEKGVEWFFDETETYFNHKIITQELFLKLTKGRFPKMMVVKDIQAERLLSGRSFNYKGAQLLLP